MFRTKSLMSLWILGALVVGALLGGVVRGQWSALAVGEASSLASSAQPGGQPYKVGLYTWSSKAVADECSAATQTNWAVPDPNGSPAHFQRPFLPVNGKGGEDLSGPYEPVMGWPQPLHTDWRFGNQAGLYVESPDRIFLVQRNEIPPRSTPLMKAGYVWGPDVFAEVVKANVYPGIRTGEHHAMVFDRQGKLIEPQWSQWDSLFKSDFPMAVNVSRYDADSHIWVTTGNKIHKFTRDGKRLVMSIDGNDPAGKRIGFHGGMAWLPNGDSYVIGTGSARVVKYSSEGKYLAEFGKNGTGPGEFSGPVRTNGIHGIVTDPDARRVYIGDRGNNRIQIFDENMKYLDEWPNMIAPYMVKLSKDGHVWVADSHTQKFLKYDLNGKLLTSWGTFGIVPGAMWGIHDFGVDSEGSLYQISDYATGAGAIQKWQRRKDVDPADPRLVGQLVQ